MKTKLTFLIAMLSITVFSQEEFAPIGAEWYYNYRESMDGPETGYYLLKSIKDTTIDSKVCRILSHTLMNSKGISMNKGESILYEDVKENKIYRYLFGNFYLLYDFTKTTGDTIIIKEPYSETQYDSIVTVVDSVGIETVGENIQLKVLYVRSDVGRKYDFQGKIVEKIGNLQYLYPFDQLVCDGGCPLPLRCYNDDQISFVSHEPYVMQVPCDYIYPERMNEFAPIGAEWYYSEPGFSGNPLNSYERYIVERDTVIESKKSQIIKSQNFKEVVYSENNKVYYRFKNDFKLIFDFNVNEGDTVEFDFKSYSFNSSVIDTTYKVKCVVNRIDSVENNGNYLKKFSTTILQDNNLDHIVWESNYSYMEKIGYEYDFMFVLSIPSIDEMHNLRCYKDEQINYTSDWWKLKDKPCDYKYISHTIQVSTVELNIFPNPAKNQITIYNPSNIKIKKIELIDFSGRIVQMWNATESTGNTLNIQHIFPGVYLLKAETDAGVKTEKLVVQ